MRCKSFFFATATYDRYYFGVNMLLVETYPLTNKTIRFWVCYTPCVINIATQRQLNWIGKVACMPEEEIK
jgi:hypothetical protein